MFSEQWTPKVLAQSNGQLVKIAKGSGELVWHQHDNEDELFIVFKGHLALQLRVEGGMGVTQQSIELGVGEMFVMPKGVEHCPSATVDTQFMMIEPASTAHTGELETALTVTNDQQVWI